MAKSQEAERLKKVGYMQESSLPQRSEFIIFNDFIINKFDQGLKDIFSRFKNKTITKNDVLDIKNIFAANFKNRNGDGFCTEISIFSLLKDVPNAKNEIIIKARRYFNVQASFDVLGIKQFIANTFMLNLTEINESSLSSKYFEARKLIEPLDYPTALKIAAIDCLQFGEDSSYMTSNRLRESDPVVIEKRKINFAVNLIFKKTPVNQENLNALQKNPPFFFMQCKWRSTLEHSFSESQW